MKRPVDSQCRAFQLAIGVLGRPWTALLLNVLQDGPLRFSELAERARGPGDKVLSARLKELEARGIVERHVDPGPPVRVTYALTPCGRRFGEVAGAIERWGREIAATESARPRTVRQA
ncbi:MAG TPA: helix-turn-helix domain-containing protein [Polyangiaceae bacterium]